MDLVPMAPEMPLELEPISHRCHAQLAAVREISTVLPCYCIGFHVLLWKLCATPLLVDWCRGWVGWGAKFFSRSRLARRTLHSQPAVLKALHWNLSVWCRTRAGWWRTCSLLLQAQWRQSFVAAVGQHSVAVNNRGCLRLPLNLP